MNVQLKTVDWRCSVKGDLKNFPNFTAKKNNKKQKHTQTPASESPAFFIKLEALGLQFYYKKTPCVCCEFCEMFKNNFFEEHIR